MSRRQFLISAGSILATGSVGEALAGGATIPKPTAAIGKPAPAFEVIDTANRKRTLAEFSGRQVVLEWTSPSCPFATAQYMSGRMPELQRWAAQHNVVWLSILSSHPSRSDYLVPAKAEAFNRQRGGAPAALLIDSSGVMGRSYGAITANHMFVIAADGALVYAGGIDDSNSFDVAAVKSSRNFVRAALEELAASRAVSHPKTDPYGCSLAYEG